MEDWETVDVPTHPVKGGRWVAAVAEIRDNATGVVREHESHETMMDGDPDPGDFIWSDGNYSCDCNRRLFFARAAGEDEDWDGGCSDGLYAVRLRNKRTGRVYYNEFDA
jgi:hypothetical protein